jgi:hypothetical protein
LSRADVSPDKKIGAVKHRLQLRSSGNVAPCSLLGTFLFAFRQNPSNETSTKFIGGI